MKTFLLLHCPYNPNGYTGHRIDQIEAEDYEAAKVKANDLLQRRVNTVQWEFRLVEVAADSGYRLHKTDEVSWLVGGKY